MKLKLLIYIFLSNFIFSQINHYLEPLSFTSGNNNIKDLPTENMSPKKLSQIGYILKQFYIFHNDPLLEEAFLFTFGFHGYIDNILGINDNIANGHIHSTTFVNNTKTSTIGGETVTERQALSKALKPKADG